MLASCPAPACSVAPLLAYGGYRRHIRYYGKKMADQAADSEPFFSVAARRRGSAAGGSDCGSNHIQPPPPDDYTTRPSMNEQEQEQERGAAARARRYREKKMQGGVRQVNVQVPEQHIDAIKRIAQRLRDGSDMWEAVRPELPPPPPPPPLTEADKLASAARKARGWRRVLLRWMLL